MAYVDLLRPSHWFKNLFIFAGVLAGTWRLGFVPLSPSILGSSMLAFVLASFVSSSNYIVNQITDLSYDKKHPTKRNRPIPSGKVSVKIAWIVATALFLLSVGVASFVFVDSLVYSLAALFIAGIFYNVPPIRLKDVVYIDVIAESVNNPVRFAIGWFVVVDKVFPPTLLLFVTFTMAALLLTGKRYDELRTLGKKLTVYRKTFASYTTGRLKLIIYFYALLTLSFFILISLQFKPQLLFLFPLVVIYLRWVVKKIISGEAKAREVETFMQSTRFAGFTALLAILSVLLVFYA